MKNSIVNSAFVPVSARGSRSIPDKGIGEFGGSFTCNDSDQRLPYQGIETVMFAPGIQGDCKGALLTIDVIGILFGRGISVTEVP